MQRAWTMSVCLAAASLTLVAGCAKSLKSVEVVQNSSGSSCKKALTEPAPFKAPKGAAIKHIAEAENLSDRGARTTSNEEQENKKSPSVLKQQAPKTAASADAPRPLPQRNSRDNGDFAVVEKRARQVIDQAFKLADRGAIYSARIDLLKAMEVLCDARDSINGNRACTRALAEALTAMEEAADFLPRGEARISLRSLIDGHKTTVLKDANLEKISNLLAMYRYNTFAQQKLIEAGAGSHAASEALCGLGKVARQLPADDATSRRYALSSALVFQVSAVGVWNENYHAANESGVLYFQLGHPKDAKQILIEVAETTNWPTAWGNLARVHEQLKEYDLADAATTEMRLAQKANPQMATSKIGPSEFRWVSPEQFIEEGPNATPTIAGRPSAPQKR